MAQEATRTPVRVEITQIARERLAAEYERDGWTKDARDIREGRFRTSDDERALVALSRLEAERACNSHDELLAAAKGALQYEGHLVYCGHGRDMDRPCVCGLNAAHDALRAAIAKAERGE